MIICCSENCEEDQGERKGMETLVCSFSRVSCFKMDTVRNKSLVSLHF